MIAPLSQSYHDARSAFLRAARTSCARTESFEHPRTGLHGESLYIDVAEVGPRDAASVVIVVSGTHGVEGYLGSALQRHHLETLRQRGKASRSGAEPTLILVHALNPYGFSWVRRVNEDNVDLNRNFIDWTQTPPANDDYAELADTLVPPTWNDDDQQRTQAALLAKLDAIGFERSQQIISSGQFTHPDGIFYGGNGPTWSNRWLHEFLSERLKHVRHAAIIDIHTGLGPWAEAELISSEEPNSDALERQRRWWEGVTVLREGNSVSAEISGEWLGTVDQISPSTEFTSITIEYGTVDAVTVLNSLRADAVLHATEGSGAANAAEVRSLVRNAFVDDDPAWLEACWPSYERVVSTAISRLGGVG